MEATNFFIAQCQAFMQQQDLSSLDIPVAEGAVTNIAGNRVFITLTEAFLPGTPDVNTDYFFFFLLRFNDNPVHKDIALFLGPGSIVNFMSNQPNGKIVADLPVAECGNELYSVGVALYKIARSARSRKLVDATEKLVSALDYNKDYAASITLAKTILSRLEILVQYEEVSLLLGKTHYFIEPLRQELYLCVFNAGSQKKDKRALWIKDGGVFIGHTSDTAVPMRYYEHLTIRIGAQPSKKNTFRSINELRRQYALTLGESIREEDKKEIGQRIEQEELLKKERRLSRHFGKKSVKRVPLLTPISIEIARDLEPLVTSENNAFTPNFQLQVDKLRQDLQKETGYTSIPGIRVRSNDSDLSPGTYIIIINEIPLVLHTIPPKKFLCLNSVAQLKALGIDSEAVPDPDDGKELAWIEATDREIAEKAGLEIWEASYYMTLHVRALILRNFSTFINIQNVSDRFETEAAAHCQSIRQAKGGIARFTGILKAFAMEQVPALNLEAIVVRYLKLTAEDAPAYEIYEELRMLDSVRNYLPGNRDDQVTIPVCSITDEISETISNGIIKEGDTIILALEPETTQELLTAVRNEVGNLPRGVPVFPVIVNDWKIRHLLRKLVELEFPDLKIIATRELKKDFSVFAKISLTGNNR